LLSALARLGHEVLVLTPEQSLWGDAAEPDGCEADTYADLAELKARRADLAMADVLIMGSGLPEARPTARLVQQSARRTACFYDLDADCDPTLRDPTPDWDLYLSAVGGPALERIERRWRARAARALYACIDPGDCARIFQEPLWDLGCLVGGDVRTQALNRLLVEAARRAPDLRFAIAGDLPEPDVGAWPDNLDRLSVITGGGAGPFFGACRFVLDLASQGRWAAGFSPTTELFQAAASGAAVISDSWQGLSALFAPEREINVVGDTGEVLKLLRWTSERDRRQMAETARRRVLAHHTADRRAEALEDLLIEAREGRTRSSHALARAPI
jgi:spore maturation protein CgeB